MKTLIIALAALTATAGFAQETQAPATDTDGGVGTEQAAARPAKDPNERICRNIPQTSTRLGRKQECHTRAEWADLRHQDRQMVDEAQTRRGMNGR